MTFGTKFQVVDGRLRCSKCLRDLDISCFQADKRRVRGMKAACRECEMARCRAWYERNAQKERDSARSRMAAVPAEKSRAAVAKWRASLADGYVRQRLCYRTSLKPEDLPQSLVEAKRLELSIKRLVKKMEQSK